MSAEAARRCTGSATTGSTCESETAADHTAGPAETTAASASTAGTSVGAAGIARTIHAIAGLLGALKAAATQCGRSGLPGDLRVGERRLHARILGKDLALGLSGGHATARSGHAHGRRGCATRRRRRGRSCRSNGRRGRDRGRGRLIELLGGRGVPTRQTEFLDDTTEEGEMLAVARTRFECECSGRAAALTEETGPVGAVRQLDGHGDQHRLAADGDAALLDGDEARERRGDRVRLAEPDDLRLPRRLERLALHRGEARQQDLIDLRACPQRLHDIVLRFGAGEIHLHGALPCARTRAAAHGDRTAGGAIEAAHEHDRLLVVQVGQVLARGKHIVDAEARGDVDFDIGEHRRLDAAHQAVDHAVRFIGERDDLAGPAAGTRHLLEQEAVDAVADAEAEHARCAGVLLHGGDHALVVADVAVGQEEHESRARVGVLEAGGARDEHAVAVARLPGAVDDQRELLRVRRHGDRQLDRYRAARTGVERILAIAERERPVRHRHANAAAVGRQVEQLGRCDAAAPVLHQRGVDRRHHLGAARAERSVDEVLGELAVLGGRLARLGPQHAGRAGEGDEVEGVVVAHRGDRLACERLRLLDGESVHRSRGVEDEHEFARSDLGGSDARRRIEHEREVPALDGGVRRVADMREETGFDRGVGDLPAQDEVAVRDGLAVIERDRPLRGGLRLDGDGVELAGHIGDRGAARVDRHAHADVMARALGRLDRHGRDARCVGHLVGVAGEARALVLAERRVEEASIELTESARREVHAALGASVAVLRGESDALAELQQLVDRLDLRGGHGDGGLEELRQARRRERRPGRDLDARGRAQHDSLAHRPALGQRGDRRGVPGDVARPDDHREHILRHAVAAPRELDGGDAHDDLRAGFDVGDRLREDVRALLLEQAGDIAGLARLLVDGAGERAFLDLALDGLRAAGTADDHRHAVDRGAVREREGVHRLDRARIRIRVGLLDDGAREEAADLDLHIGVLQRAGTEGVAVVVERVERAALGDLHDPAVGERLALAAAHEEEDERRGEGEHRGGREQPREADAPDHAGPASGGEFRFDRREHLVAAGGGARLVLVVPRAQQFVEAVAARGFGGLVAVGHDWRSSRVSCAEMSWRASATRR